MLLPIASSNLAWDRTAEFLKKSNGAQTICRQRYESALLPLDHAVAERSPQESPMREAK